MIARAVRRLCAPGLFALCLGAAAAFAQENAGTPGTAPLQAIQLTLEVGEIHSLGPGKLSPLRCDEPDLVEPVFTDSGLGLRGVKPGSTLCSVYSATGSFVSYQVRVVAPRPPTQQRKK